MKDDTVPSDGAPVDLDALLARVARLEEQEQRYRLLTEHAGVGIGFWDREGRARVMNRVALGHLGLPWDEVEGRTFAELFGDEAGAEYGRRLARAVETGSIETYEDAIALPSGRTWFQSIYTPIPDETGELRGVQIISRDVTGQKRAEAARNRAEAELRQTLLATTDGIWRWDFRTDELAFSDRYYQMLGYEPGELPATFDTWRELIHPEDRARAIAVAEAYLATKPDVYENEFRLRTKSGDYRWIRARARVVERGPEGEALLMIGTHEDVTHRVRAEAERRRLEAQVLHAQKLESLGVLAGGIAHDFNNILVAILGNVSLALMDLPAEHPVRPVLKKVELAAVRAGDLANQMLAYSGKGQFVVEPLDLSRVVEEMTHLVEVSISKMAQITYELSEELPAVEADATQMRQVVLNLVTNASEAIGDRVGRITISTGVMEADSAYLRETYLDDELPAGLYAYLEVSDTGSGMDEETRARLFDPFFSTKFTGRGLGLSAVLGIVRGHKGAIKVYSEPGRGTTFKVLFPSRRQAAAKPLPPEAALASAWRASGLVLVVDDEEVVRFVARTALERVGFRVIVATNGLEAVERYRAHAGEISAVLLDLTMPLLDGEAAFREIRRIKADAKILLMSGYSEQEAVRRFAGKGIAGFIHKPFQAATMLAAFREVVEGRRPRPPSPAPATFVHGGTVLVVDDEPEVLEVGKALLERLGYAVLMAEHGEAALEVFSGPERPIDAVILDHMMPVMDGADTFAALREVDPEAVVLFSCARMNASVAERLLANGVAGFVEKPYTLDQLAEALERALASHRR